jgi:hypothetical protein
MGEISFVFYIDDIFDICKEPGGDYYITKKPRWKTAIALNV